MRSFFEEVSVVFVWLLLILGAMLGRDTPPSPLERGGLECCFFYLIMSSLVWLLLILGAMLGRDTPPAPLERGGWNVVFSLIILVLCGCF